MKTARITAILALSASAPLTFAAGTATDQLQVTATVSAVCNVVANPLDFGTVNPLTLASADHDAAGSIDVTCSSGTSYTIALGDGANYDATNTTRQMKSGTDLLKYALYSDASRSVVWDDTTMPAATVSAGTTDNHAVYGRIPQGQNPPNGTYTDTVVVTVSF